ncbi:MAG: UDP-glucose 4-epimerase GalE [Synergistaceae bacterium]|jgi:UDP-glucose 4-epimerase|nr:UDP-glucose 4-epimerase GalE [Synergistaceae bacterium]
MSVLVTGGAGYIGSVTVDALLAAGESVAVLDDLSNGHREAVDPRVPFYESDTEDGETLAGIVKRHGIKQLVHFASFISVSESVQTPLRYFDNNLGKMVKMLSVLQSCGVENVVFSSTAAVYGEPEYVPIDEDHPQKPLNPYGLSKYFAEQVLDWVDAAYGMSHVALRYFNASGATAAKGEAHRPESHLIPLALQVPLGKRARLAVYGDDYPTPDGTCVRDYIHVADLADAHVKALAYLREGGASQKINLGNGKGFSVREIVTAAEKVTAAAIPFRVEPRREGDPAILIASSEKARKILGWTPRYPELEDIIRSAWEWHKTHPSGYST